MFRIRVLLIPAAIWSVVAASRSVSQYCFTVALSQRSKISTSSDIGGSESNTVVCRVASGWISAAPRGFNSFVPGFNTVKAVDIASKKDANTKTVTIFQLHTKAFFKSDNII